MDGLTFPMFSRLAKVRNTNIYHDHLLDDDFVQLLDITIRDPASQLYETILDCNLKYLMADTPRTCIWNLPVEARDWNVKFTSTDGVAYKLFFLEHDIFIGMIAQRCLNVSFFCSDCGNCHLLSSGDVELMYRYGFEQIEKTKAPRFELFPDELSHLGYASELLEGKTDWSIENGIIKMLEEDIEQEMRPRHSIHRNRANTSESSNEDYENLPSWEVDMKTLCLEFLIHCARSYTLSEHFELFFGRGLKKDDDFKDTMCDAIAKDDLDAAHTALIDFCYTDPSSSLSNESDRH